MLNVHIDQSGIVKLARMLPGLGMTILQLQYVNPLGLVLSNDNKESRGLSSLLQPFICGS
ncbi:MAG: hypothetical protein P8Y14_23285 [Anaerolineales bacterium]